MGFLSSIGSAISSGISSVAKGIESAVVNVAKSVAPGVIDALDSVANGAIGSLGNMLSGVAGNVPLIGGLLQNLIGKGVTGLQGLADSGIAGGVNGLVSGLGNLLNVGGQQVATPSMTGRANTAPSSTSALQQMLQQVLAQLQGKAPTAGGTTTSGGAATGTGGVSGTAPTSSTGSAGGVLNSNDAANSIINMAGGLKMPSTPPQGASQQDLMNFEKQMSDYTNMMQLLSNVLRMLEDTNKAIIGNIR